MKRRTFFSLALIPFVPAVAVAAVPVPNALDALLKQLLAASLAHYETHAIVVHPKDLSARNFITNTYANAQCACRACNGKKGGTLIVGQLPLYVMGV